MSTQSCNKFIVCLMAIGIGAIAFGNGGPFVLKYPGGDPSAKGVLSRLDSELKPARESRLRVVEENLNISFESETFRFDSSDSSTPPVTNVQAEYTIENPAAEEIEVDFGFPILRGIYTDRLSMFPRPSVTVRFGQTVLNASVISNSIIYGFIRQQARRTIDEGIAKDSRLNELSKQVLDAQPDARPELRKSIREYLVRTLQWKESDAALVAEYVGMNLGSAVSRPMDQPIPFFPGAFEYLEWQQLPTANLGILSAIGEQKATQYLAYVARLFDPKACSAYEDIFKAWGGDVRELSLDLESGQIRPREITLESSDPQVLRQMGWTDPTVYARVDYLDENAAIRPDEKDSCRMILQKLPIVFTFAPMNLLHYRAKFPAKTTEKLTVSYRQYACLDTKAPASYQLAYVVHPASFWDSFGPIHLQVQVPKGISPHASVAWNGAGQLDEPGATMSYRSTVKDKTGELYIALQADEWKRQAPSGSDAARLAAQQQASRMISK